MSNYRGMLPYTHGMHAWLVAALRKIGMRQIDFRNGAKLTQTEASMLMLGKKKFISQKNWQAICRLLESRGIAGFALSSSSSDDDAAAAKVHAKMAKKIRAKAKTREAAKKVRSTESHVGLAAELLAAKRGTGASWSVIADACDVSKSTIQQAARGVDVGEFQTQIREGLDTLARGGVSRGRFVKGDGTATSANIPSLLDLELRELACIERIRNLLNG